LPFAAVEIADLSDARRVLSETPDETPAQIRRKKETYQRWREQSARDQMACHLWTAAFFTPLTRAHLDDQRIPTTDTLRRYLQRSSVDERVTGAALALAERLRFFHWELEFPEVFSGQCSVDSGQSKNTEYRSLNTGFDCILSNPPWERIKLQEEEFFAARDPQIAIAPNKAARQKLIDALPKKNPALAQEFESAKHDAEATSKFVRASGRFPLTAIGDVNTYALFAEHARTLLNANGRVGIILPTGIATDDTTKTFFGDLIAKQALASLYDFENREALFPGVHRSYKFCLLTLSGKPTPRGEFSFFATRVEHLRDERRRFALTAEEIALINPNTRTMPVFRTRADAELTRKIYERVPVLVNERTGENPWDVRFLAMFHMANDSGMFESAPADGLLPLYEAKMMWHFDHRWATYEGGETRDCTEAEKRSPHFVVRPRYWVPRTEVQARLGDWQHKWLVGFRDVTNATNERTAIFSLLPRFGVGNNAPLLLVAERDASSLSHV
jgi:hypothetical protein